MAVAITPAQRKDRIHGKRELSLFFLPLTSYISINILVYLLFKFLSFSLTIDREQFCLCSTYDDFG
jgi:hypothetical protein